MCRKRKKIAIFGCSFTSRYRKDLCRTFNIAAEEMNVDLYYFNSRGKIGYKNRLYNNFEYEILDYIDLSAFDGIVFDGEGYDVEGIADKIFRKLCSSNIPIVSISSQAEGVYNIDFQDTNGIRMIIEHFINVHHFTKIGFMSGYLTHPDAQVRLKEFQSVMREHGMPEDGAGVFEGDFWFNKGNDAADYFLSLPERPEAIVCANDYMALALSKALKMRGIKIPKDIAISGFDGTVEGKDYLPNLTSATRERRDIARKTLKLLVDLSDGKNVDNIDLHIRPKIVLGQSCGCIPINYEEEAENINLLYEQQQNIYFNMYDAESSILKLNMVDNVRNLETTFSENSDNFGEYNAFFLMMHIDKKRRPAYDSEYTSPTGSFLPAVWIDKNNDYVGSPRQMNCSSLVPEPNSDRSHFYYIMSVQCADRAFGYTVIEMSGKDIFNDFFNVWLLNIAITLETILKNDSIKKLIKKLENLSKKDDLTGMLNRRGFDDFTREAISGLREPKNVCTMVVDMDGLKRINDEYGHYEGDRAIKTVADILIQCCDSGEIAGRMGGDEFYILAIDYTEKLLNRFLERLNGYVKEFNDKNDKPYRIGVSCGTCMEEISSLSKLDELLKISDERMYNQKLGKPGRRK
ncbi:MAG: GGDEF domain-containing protein [Ruminococcus sp.]|nr:GGDEF domain-containing protein [Ruminococcus sp.]